MLDEYKRIYETSADIIPNWREMNKNDLVNSYIDNEKTSLKDNYLSAIICRYWNCISKYYSLSKSYATVEDCYDILIDALQNILNRRPWKDETKKISKDINGPDKSINRCIKTTWLNFYQAQTRDKRATNINKLDIDSLDKPVIDAIEYNNCSRDTETLIDMYSKKIVKELFRTKDYLSAFCVDLIIYSNTFESEDGFIELNIKKLVKVIHHLDDNYLHIFSEYYDIDFDKVKKGSNYIINTNSEVLKECIPKCFEQLQKNYFGEIYKEKNKC